MENVRFLKNLKINSAEKKEIKMKLKEYFSLELMLVLFAIPFTILGLPFHMTLWEMVDKDDYKSLSLALVSLPLTILTAPFAFVGYFFMVLYDLYTLRSDWSWRYYFND